MSTMTDSERDVIHRFAAGDKALRARAVETFRAHQQSCPDSPEIRFMAETTSLVPDYLLLALYRRQFTRPNSGAQAELVDRSTASAG